MPREGEMGGECARERKRHDTLSVHMYIRSHSIRTYSEDRHALTLLLCGEDVVLEAPVALPDVFVGNGNCEEGR